MAVIVTRKFPNHKAVNSFYLGKLRGGVDLTKLGNQLFIHGLTLVFTTPAGTVTFAATPAGAQVPLKLTDVKAQIEAQVATVKAEIIDGALQLYAATPGTITLANTGTANAFFGFDTSVAQTAKPLAPPSGSAPKFVALNAGFDGSLYVTSEE